ncbi:hypothetical protein CDD82_1210 [Ophiocordyceps australis]|uniref:Ribosomal RNA-processing protein 15 n=1 Tax=Ophiocordyceps australis TaxID=1399860 RepID=A0A2C5ZN29_9HYPO|nr:hypothetical protein CDD82_1210 [Ophiocordyceps australis]
MKTREMASRTNKKRGTDSKTQRPSKKQKRQQEYHSGSESDVSNEVDGIGLLDSDDDVHDLEVDEAKDVGDSDSSGSSEGVYTTKLAAKMETTHTKPKVSVKSSAEASSSGDDGYGDQDEDGQDDSDLDQDDAGSDTGGKKSTSKRNDPSAFATSISKILSTKISASKRSDPVLSRSAAAHEASKAVLDGALETKARRQLKEQKRKALEKGRIKDVLMAPKKEENGEPEMTTAEIMETEKKLRKTAHRGVVKMFNAVRAAQVKASEAERLVRKEGVIGIGQRELKAKELSKKGFLELIASGGGGLKKGGLEEA